MKRGDFLFVIERDLLPEALLQTRLATLAALSRSWAPDRAISLSGKGSEPYARGIVSQLPRQERRDVAASGAFQIHRSTTMALTANGRMHLVTLDRTPPLGDEVYPAGPVGAERSIVPSSTETTNEPPRAPAGSRSAEILGDVPPDAQARVFGALFAYIADQWRAVGDRLKEAHRTLDQALEADLEARNPFGRPKAGTEWNDLDPKLQAKVNDDFVRNWKAYGFESESEATSWTKASKVQQSYSYEVCGFGRWDNGRGGAYMPVHLFTP